VRSNVSQMEETMAEITVWTKQNKAVIDQLETAGRFIADERYMRRELEDTADIMLFIYRWLAGHMPAASAKPQDVLFPVWVSFTKETTMSPERGYAILELRVPEELVTPVNIEKWTRITNYSFIPLDEEDEAEHNNLLRNLGISNAQAVMSNFYPDIRSKIISSWDRLFDDTVKAGSSNAYGLMWEVRKEWVQKMTV